MWTLLLLLVLHFIGDFLLQSDWVAVNKSKRNEVLTLHVLVYSLCFLPFGWKFWLLTFYSHWATDWVTSRIASRLWFFGPTGWNMDTPGIRAEMAAYPEMFHYSYIPGRRHWFFVAIGADQLIHAATLAATYALLQ